MHLELSVALHAVRVVAVAAVVWADAGLGVADVPRLRAQDAQEGGGVHSSCANLSGQGGAGVRNDRARGIRSSADNVPDDF